MSENMIKQMSFLTPHLGQNILIFNNQAGGGHKEACIALTDTIRSQDKTAKVSSKIIEKDILADTHDKTLASFFYNQYNNARKNERHTQLELLPYLQIFSDLFFGLPIAFKCLLWIFRYRIEVIVNPQPLAIGPMIRAVRLVNFIYKHILHRPEVKFYTVLTEMPTNKTDDYFTAFKRLSKYDKKNMTLVTGKPLLTNHVNDNQFWKEETSLPEESILIDQFPIRLPFLEMAKINPDDIQQIEVCIQRERSKKNIKKLLTASNLNYSSDSDHVNQKTSIHIPKDAFVSMVMLGSQANQTSTLSYVDKMIETQKRFPSSEPNICFVFCGNDDHPASLFSKVSNLLQIHQNNPDWPKNLTIIPLEKQPAQMVASTMRRSDRTITCVGGITAMELYTVTKPSAQLFLHDIHTLSWETGNADYLFKEKNAHEISPFNFPYEKFSARGHPRSRNST